MALGRPLRLETSSGMMMALLCGGAAIAVEFGAGGGVVGWVLGALCVAGTTLGLARGWSLFPHHIQRIRHSRRIIRIGKRFGKAAKRFEAGAGDAHRVEVFRQTIIEGCVLFTALGAVMLFRELAGEDAFVEEIAQERAPLWPAWLCFRAASAKEDGDTSLVKDLLEKAFVTEHPIWATAAAVQLLDDLSEAADRERFEELTEWISKRGDPAVVTELLFYR
ncbi:MAG TPA: hypothetical protein VKC63_06210 [Solirubrobacterales bacterium]|nr:hypothetical protein [Solirubrobacterales bacterium]